MMPSTKVKIMLARIVFFAVMTLRRLFGLDSFTNVKRGGFFWFLDLSEGIDFAIYLTGAFEPRTISAYSHYIPSGGVAIDVGANMGAHTLPLANMVSETGRVLAFEPTASAFMRLTRNLAENPSLKERVTALQVMLTRETGVDVPTEIFASWPMVGGEVFHEEHLGVLISTNGAQAKTLDSAIEEAGVKKVDFIKIDVDGFEMDVLYGARSILSLHRPTIVMELAPYTWLERGESVLAPVELLDDLGYRFYDLSRKPFPDIKRFTSEMPAGHSVNVIVLPEGKSP